MTSAVPPPAAPDVRELRQQELPADTFPGGRGQDFRIHFTAEVHRALWRHALETTAVEVCGVLVGRWGQDADGPFVVVSESIRGEAAENKFAEVTFTHQTWAKINEEMDQKYADLSIVGWYHTHPDFGVFLSDRDLFIQQHFFSGPGQIAHVLDPIRRTEGVFIWKDGKPTLAPYCWVGNELKLGTAAGSEERPSAALPAAAPAVAPPAAPPLERVLLYLVLFLLGYLIAGWGRSAWEHDRIAEGVVAHQGLWRFVRPGLGEHLDRLSTDLQNLNSRVETLSADHLKRLESAPSAEPLRSDWRSVRSGLSSASEYVARLKDVYALSPAEADALQQLVLDELRRMNPKARAIPAAPAAPKSSGSGGTSQAISSEPPQESSTPKP